MLFTNYKTHVILRCIYKQHTSKYQESGRGVIHDDSLTVIEIHKNTKLNISYIENICNNLINYNFIEFTQCGKDDNGKNHRYKITILGSKAYLDKYFLHKLGNFYRGWLPVVISLVATALSVSTCVDSSSNRKELKTVKQEVQYTKESLDSVKLESNKQQIEGLVVQ